MFRSRHKLYRKLFLKPSFAVALLLSFLREYYPCPLPDNNLLTRSTNTILIKSLFEEVCMYADR